jgi:hypothetical protein
LESDAASFSCAPGVALAISQIHAFPVLCTKRDPSSQVCKTLPPLMLRHQLGLTSCHTMYPQTSSYPPCAPPQS